MSGSTRHAATILRIVQRQHLSTITGPIKSIHSSIPVQSLLTRHSIAQRRQQFRQFSLTRYNMNGSNNTPGVKGSVERPPSTIQTSKIMPVATPAPDVSENVKSIEQVIADIDPDIKKSQSSTRASETLEPSFSSDPTSSESSSSTAPPESESGSSSSARPKRPSRTWFYLYQILYWCTVGSIPVHLLLIKSETKEVREKQEWKIAVLTDMRDKLKRGDSVEEEEALLSVGMDRSEREEQVDDKYFEDLLTSAEKLDFTFGDKDRANTELEIALSTPVVSTPTPASPAVPRKPAPPKSEKSYL